MAPVTRAAAKKNSAQLTGASPAGTNEQKSVAKGNTRVGAKRPTGKKKVVGRGTQAGSRGKGRGRTATSNDHEQSEGSANNDGEQHDAQSSGEETSDGESGSNARTTGTRDAIEQSMINADYDLQHALQFDLILGFHQSLLIFSRIVHKRLMSRRDMHAMTPDDIAGWWTNRLLVKELASYEFDLEQGERIDWQGQNYVLVLNPTKDQRQRFEGTQRQRYEGWYFQVRDKDGNPIKDRNHEVITSGEVIAGRGEGQIYYSFFRYEPPIIAREVLQRPITRPEHVYFATSTQAQRQVQFREDRDGSERLRHDFAQCLVENNASIPGIRSRRIRECLNEKKKTDNDANTWSSHGIRLTTPLQSVYHQSYYTRLLQGLNGPAQQKSFFTTTNLCGTSVHVTHPDGFDLATLQHLAYILVMYEDQINKLFPPHRRPDINAIAWPHHKWGQKILSNKRSFAVRRLPSHVGVERKWLFDEHDQAWRLHSVKCKFKTLGEIRNIIFDQAMTLDRLQDLMNPRERSLPWEHRILSEDKALDWTPRDYLVSFQWADPNYSPPGGSPDLSFPPTIEFRQLEGEDDLANLKWWVIFCRGLVRLANHMAHSGLDPAVPGDGNYPHSEWSDDILLSDLFDLMSFPDRGRERLHLRAVYQARRHFAMQQKYRPPLEQRGGIGLADQSLVRGYQWKKQALFDDTYEKWWREGRTVRENRQPGEVWPGDDPYRRDRRGHGNGNRSYDDSNDRGYFQRPPTPGDQRDTQRPVARWRRAPSPVRLVREEESIRRVPENQVPHIPDIQLPHIPDNQLPSMYDIDRWLEDETSRDDSMVDRRYADLEFMRIHMADFQRLTNIAADSNEMSESLLRRLAKPMADRARIRVPENPKNLHTLQQREQWQRDANQINGIIARFHGNLENLYIILVRAANRRQDVEARARLEMPFTHDDYARADGDLRREDFIRLGRLWRNLTELIDEQTSSDAPIVLYELGASLVGVECIGFARKCTEGLGVLPSGIFQLDDYRNFEAYMKFLVEILVNAMITRQHWALVLSMPPEAPFTPDEYRRAWMHPPNLATRLHRADFPQIGPPPWSPLPPRSPDLLSSQQLANYRWLWERFVLRNVRLTEPRGFFEHQDRNHPWIDYQKGWQHIHSPTDEEEQLEPMTDMELEQRLSNTAFLRIADMDAQSAQDMAECCLKILNMRILTNGPDEHPLGARFTYLEYAKVMGYATPDYDYDRLPRTPALRHLGFPVEGDRRAHIIRDDQRIEETQGRNPPRGSNRAPQRNRGRAISSHLISPGNGRRLPPLEQQRAPVAGPSRRRQRSSNDEFNSNQHESGEDTAGNVGKRKSSLRNRPNSDEISVISTRRQANRNMSGSKRLVGHQPTSPGVTAKRRWEDNDDDDENDDEDDEDELAMKDGWSEKVKRGGKRVSWAEGVKGSGRGYGGKQSGDGELSYELVELEKDGTERVLNEEELRNL